MGNKYISVAVAGYNSAPPSDDGATTDANKIKWSTGKTKLTDPLLTAIQSIDTQLVSTFDTAAVAKTANYTTTVSDHLKLIEANTAAIVISLIDAGTGAAGYSVAVYNGSTGQVTVGRATAGNTLNGSVQNLILQPNGGAEFRVNAAANGYDVVSTYAPSIDVGSSGGTANAITFTAAPAITGLYSGLTISGIVITTNTGSTTLNLNGLGVKSIFRNGATNLSAGDLTANRVYLFRYDGTQFRLLNPSSATSVVFAATGNIAATDVQGAIAELDSEAVHLAGTETISGSKTFTASPLTLSAANAFFIWKDTGQTLPAGTFAWQSTGGAIRILRNTAAAGDFSTATAPLTVSATDTATFLSTVGGADGTAATHFATKGQLDAKVYGVRITNNGTAAISYGPAGWSVSRSSIGVLTITHNFGSTNYSFTATQEQSGAPTFQIASLGTNTFQIITRDNSAVATDTNLNITVVRN